MRKKIIDLTQKIYVGMPIYDFMLHTQLFCTTSYDDIREASGGKHIATMWGMLLCDHAGTHVDAISHVSEAPEALTIDQQAIEDFITEAVCVDVSHIQYPDYVTREVLEKALDDANLTIEKGDTFIYDMGHYRKYYPSKKYLANHTGLDREATEWLADQGVINIGVDCPTIEHIDMWKSNDFPAHHVCAERNLLNTENLCNLELVSGKRFTFIGLPLPLEGLSASPIRAVALLDNEF